MLQFFVTFSYKRTSIASISAHILEQETNNNDLDCKHIHTHIRTGNKQQWPRLQAYPHTYLNRKQNQQHPWWFFIHDNLILEEQIRQYVTLYNSFDSPWFILSILSFSWENHEHENMRSDQAKFKFLNRCPHKKRKKKHRIYAWFQDSLRI